MSCTEWNTCVKTVRCIGQCQGEMATLTCSTLQIGTQAWDLVCNVPFILALPSSSISLYNINMMFTLSVLSLTADDRQFDRRAANTWHASQRIYIHASRLPHCRSDVLVWRNLLDSATVPTGSMAVRTVLTSMCLAAWSRPSSWASVSYFKFAW